MAKTYKLWIEIEEYDDETDTYTNCTENGLAEPVPVGLCSTLGEAITEAEHLGDIYYNPQLTPLKKDRRKLKILKKESS